MLFFMNYNKCVTLNMKTFVIKFIDSSFKRKWEVIKTKKQQSYYDIKTLLQIEGYDVRRVLNWKAYD